MEYDPCSFEGQNASAPGASGRKAPALLEGWEQQATPEIPRKRHAGHKQKDQDWRTWSRFRLWRKLRPFAGSILMSMAGILVLWAPLCQLPFVLTPSNPAWSSLLVGVLLLMMAGSQVLFPFYAPVTGSIGLFLSLVSVLVALGGMGIGVILGLIGSSLSIAWRPTRPLRAQMAAQLILISMYGAKARTDKATARPDGSSTGRAENAHMEKRKQMNRTIKSILLYHKDKKSHPLQSYFSVEEQGQTPFIPGGTPLRGANQAQGVSDQPPIGRINRRIYWSVFLGALLLVCMVNMIAQGVLAISFESTIPLAITAPAMTLENFAITTGFSGGVLSLSRVQISSRTISLSARSSTCP